MSKKIEFFIFFVVVVVLIGWGQYIIPIKLEISDTQVVETIGLDVGDNEDVSVSLLFEPLREEGDQASPKEKNLTVTSNSFIGAEKGIQNYEDKIFIGSHIKNVIIGENMAKNNLIRALEFLSKNNEFRLDSKIYIAKESSANEIFSQAIDNGYIVSDRIDNLSLSDRGQREVRSVEVVDIIRLMLSTKKAGVIPCIQLVKTGEKQLSDYIINASEDEQKRVELAGYGVIKDAKLIGYLGTPESMGYDLVRNLISEEGIKLNYNGDVVGVALTGSSSKMKFEFDEYDLSKVIIEIETTNSILESNSGRNFFAGEIGKLEELENAYIKDVVETAIDYSQDVNVDFLEIGVNLELKHPYKWRKIKDKWNDIFSTITVEVRVNSNIDEQYGVLSSTGRG